MRACVCLCLQIHILVSGSGVYLYASISGFLFFFLGGWGRLSILFCSMCKLVYLYQGLDFFLSVVLQILCVCVCVSISFLLRFNMETDLMWMDT